MKKIINSLYGIGKALSRTEMKQIIAGAAGECLWCECWDYGYYGCWSRRDTFPPALQECRTIYSGCSDVTGGYGPCSGQCVGGGC